MQIKTTMRYYLTLVRMAAVKKSTNNKYWRGCREKGTLLQLVGMKTGTATVENSVEIPLKTGTRTAIPSPAFIVCRLVDDRHSDQCEMIPHCGFDLHFSNNE